MYRLTMTLYVCRLILLHHSLHCRLLGLPSPSEFVLLMDEHKCVRLCTVMLGGIIITVQLIVLLHPIRPVIFRGAADQIFNETAYKKFSRTGNGVDVELGVDAGL